MEGAGAWAQGEPVPVGSETHTHTHPSPLAQRRERLWEVGSAGTALRGVSLKLQIGAPPCTSETPPGTGETPPCTGETPPGTGETAPCTSETLDKITSLCVPWSPHDMKMTNTPSTLEDWEKFKGCLGCRSGSV